MGSHERPILFSGPMVCAILEGRKTQTRRIIKPQPEMVDGWIAWKGSLRCPMKDRQRLQQLTQFCPYGQPGDRLWVRETWGIGSRPDPHEGWRDGIENRADEAHLEEGDSLPLYPATPPDGKCLDDFNTGKWRSARFMYRWASRLTLEITSLRVERLQEISEEDAASEGCLTMCNFVDNIHHIARGCDCVRDRFSDLWDTLHPKKDRWADNPWVWAIGFKRS